MLLLKESATPILFVKLINPKSFLDGNHFQDRRYPVKIIEQKVAASHIIWGHMACLSTASVTLVRLMYGLQATG